MPLYKSGCRATDRTQMKKLQLQGFTPKKISESVRVDIGIVNEVLSGAWDEKETEAAKRQQKINAERITGKFKEEQDKISMIAAAAAQAVKASMTNDPVVDESAIRAEIEAQVRAEMEAEKPKRNRRTKAEMEEAESNQDAA